MKAALTAATLLLAAAAAWADGARPPPPEVYLQECAACHAPYPARRLGATAWQRIVDGLPRHFGTDASLDASTTARVRAYLVANASRKAPEETPPDLRLTRSAWFVREHREIPAATWQRPAVKSAANCAACHTRSDQGVFDEHDVRIPR
jgi:mono/diheme cytochrome c family protein